jgi:hypothetical protein
MPELDLGLITRRKCYSTSRSWDWTYRLFVSILMGSDERAGRHDEALKYHRITEILPELEEPSDVTQIFEPGLYFQMKQAHTGYTMPRNPLFQTVSFFWPTVVRHLCVSFND